VGKVGSFTEGKRKKNTGDDELCVREKSRKPEEKGKRKGEHVFTRATPKKKPEKRPRSAKKKKGIATRKGKKRGKGRVCLAREGKGKEKRTF